MQTIEVAAKIAAHPRVVVLRSAQQRMIRTLNQDYGPNFMEEVDSIVGFEGVNRWTTPQREAYEALSARLTAVRAALRYFYTNA